MADTLYVKNPGGVIVHLKDGTSTGLTYGEVVPVDDLAPYVDPSTFSDTTRRQGTDLDRAILEEAQRRAALTENGQVNSSSSPVPGNYKELDEDGASQLVANLARFPESQAAVVLHEILYGGNRQKVLDAASEYAIISAHAQLPTVITSDATPTGPSLSGFGDPDVSPGSAVRTKQIEDNALAGGPGGFVPAPSGQTQPIATPDQTNGSPTDTTSQTGAPTGDPATAANLSQPNGSDSVDGGEAPEDYSGFSYDQLKAYIDQHNLPVAKNLAQAEMISQIQSVEGYEKPVSPPPAV